MIFHPPPTVTLFWRCSLFLHWLGHLNNNAKRDRHLLYQTQPQTQRTRRPMKVYPTLLAEEFLSALLSSPVMEELALDLQTMQMVSVVFCSLPMPILVG
jgi:hypothetical protein